MTALTPVLLQPKVFYHHNPGPAAPEAVVAEVAQKEIRFLAFVFIGITTGVFVASGALASAVVLSLNLLVYALIVKTAQRDFYQENGSMDHIAKAVVYTQCLFWGTLLLAGMLGGLAAAAVFWGTYLGQVSSSMYGILFTASAGMFFMPWCKSQLDSANLLSSRTPQFAQSFATLHERLQKIGNPDPYLVQGLLKVYQAVVSEDTEEYVLGLVKDFKEESPDLFRAYFTLLLPIITEELAVRIVHTHSEELLAQDFLEGLNQTELRFTFTQAFQVIDSRALPLSDQLQEPLLFLLMAKKAVSSINHPLIAHLLSAAHEQLQDKALFQELASILCSSEISVEEMAWLLCSYPDLNELTFIRQHFSPAQIDSYFYIDKLPELEQKSQASETVDEEKLSIHDTLYQALYRLRPFESDSILKPHLDKILLILQNLDADLEARGRAHLQEHTTHATPIPECWKGELAHVFFERVIDSIQNTEENQERIRELRALERQLS